MSQYNEEVIKPGDKASKLAHQICVGSYSNNPAVEIISPPAGNFRGTVDFLWKPWVLQAMLERKIRETVQNDGAGGKPQFFTLLGDEATFRRLGWEVIVMSADDVARSGGYSALMVNDLNTKAITPENFHLVEALLHGYGRALMDARLINITGEIAIMKNSITAFCDYSDAAQFICTWGGACIGLKATDRIIDGSRIGPGMLIIGLHERGYRCNGGGFFTDLLLERVMKTGTKKEIFNKLKKDYYQFISQLTAPSISYARTISRLNGWDDDGTLREPLARIAGIAHITGGGIWGKFCEMLPKGIGAVLKSMPAPQEVLLHGQLMSQDSEKPENRMDDLAAYGTTHGGCGMLIVAETEKDAMTIIKEAYKDNIRASIVGKTTSSAVNEVLIHSRFMERRVLSSEELKKAA